MSDPVRLRHRFGALALETGGVQYRLWAPGREAVAVLVSRTDGSHETLPLNREAEDFFVTEDRAGEGGDLYRWQVDGEGPFPDPASHFQPDGVHGSSEVVAHESFRWRHSRRLIQPREAVIYEMHIGTFTREGTFESAAARLPELQALGITAVELMPVADFPGERNWGYDGVMLFAPARSYGRPEDFKRFVDVAHGLGLAVILDVVYNHFGPDGNYLWALAGKGFFRKDRKTPWGDAINYDGAEGRPVRDFFLENLAHWMGHYRIDGFRFDATQEIRDESERHLLAELASLVHAHDGWIVAEDDRNEHRLCLSESRGGIGLDAVWADDFHHVVRVALTGQPRSWGEVAPFGFTRNGQGSAGAAFTRAVYPNAFHGRRMGLFHPFPLFHRPRRATRQPGDRWASSGVCPIQSVRRSGQSKGHSGSSTARYLPTQPARLAGTRTAPPRGCPGENSRIAHPPKNPALFPSPPTRRMAGGKGGR